MGNIIQQATEVLDHASTSPDRPSRRATIEDVAAGAGVSVATVSRAIRGLPNVATSTRERVLGVARRLDYHPDPAASRLAAGRTGTLTIAIPSLNRWYFANVVAGAEAVCADAGIEVQVIGVSSTASRNHLFDEARRLERRTDALILVDIRIEPEQVQSLVRRNVGLATVGCPIPGHAGVRIDDELVGRIAGHHLAGLGHRRTAIIGGLPSDQMNPLVDRLREQGYRAALAERGISDVTRVDGEFGIVGGHESMCRLLREPTPPTAVFALCDEVAFGALMALDDNGLEPGVDISIMGVDDHEFSQVVNLTTIRQPVADHGAIAARMLLPTLTPNLLEPPDDAAASSPTDSGPVIAEVSLVERSTTAAPAAT